jgi:hypothetical protein
MIKTLTPDQSRAIAGIARTPLGQAYVEVQAPFWDQFKAQWPSDDLAWFESLCLRSGDIAVADLTDDPDRIIPKLLKATDPSEAAQVVGHLEDGPDNFVLDMDAIAAAIPTSEEKLMALFEGSEQTATPEDKSVERKDVEAEDWNESVWRVRDGSSIYSLPRQDTASRRADNPTPKELVLLAVKAIYEQSNWTVLGIRDLEIDRDKGLAVKVAIENPETGDRVLVEGKYTVSSGIWTDRLIEAKNDSIWRVDAPAKGKKGGTRAAPKCNKGRPCGRSCIAQNRTCRQKTQGVVNQALNQASGASRGNAGVALPAQGIGSSQSAQAANQKQAPQIPDGVSVAKASNDPSDIKNVFDAYSFTVGRNDVELRITNEGNLLDANFDINGSFDLSDMSPREKARTALTLARSFQYDVSIRPDGTYYVGLPYDEDGNGQSRINAYKRFGFGEPTASLGVMYGVVRNGKLVPVSGDQVPDNIRILE